MKKVYSKMCSECYGITTKELDIPWEKDTEFIGNDGVIVNHQLVFKCDHCTCGSVTINLDPEIANIISVFNKFS